jgi:FKBP-type peptidyl-prolyl cis-trans isomerase 2
MAKVKKSDFIELDYIGKLKDGRVFDTNIEDVGKKENIQKNDYKPLIVCVGENQVVKGLDKNLDGVEAGKDYTFEISAEDAYGKKDPKLVRIVSKNIFTKQKLNPYPGMQITAEGMMGMVRSVSGGRVFVDFNHPLSGKDLTFDIRVKKIIKEVKEKVQGLLSSLLMLDPSKYKLEITGKKLKIIPEFKLPDVMLNSVTEKIKKLVPEISSIEFVEPKKESTTSE